MVSVNILCYLVCFSFSYLILSLVSSFVCICSVAGSRLLANGKRLYKGTELNHHNASVGIRKYIQVHERAASHL
jgi:hypothetical protein